MRIVDAAYVAIIVERLSACNRAGQDVCPHVINMVCEPGEASLVREAML